jgi:hypothetical protein
MKTSKITMSAVAALFALALVSRAGDPPAVNPYLTVLSMTTQAELPAKAADLVAQAKAKEQQQTTKNVVKAAVGLNPAAAAVTVGSIAQTTPTMAAVAAGTAAGLVPNQAAAIARAAAAAAPQQAGKIVEAVCRVLPADYFEVAEAVADVAPGAGREILAGVSAAIPALKEPIDKVLIADKSSVPPVSKVLEQINPTKSLAVTMTVSGGVNPVVKPPYVPPPVSPVNLYPGSGGQVPPGGRTYEDP